MAGAEQIQLQQFEVANIAAPAVLLCHQLQQISKDEDYGVQQLVLQNPALLMRVLDAQFRIKAGKQSNVLSQRLSTVETRWLHSLLREMSLQLVLSGAKDKRLFCQLHWQQARRTALFARELALALASGEVLAVQMNALLMHAGMLVLEQQHKSVWMQLFLETGSQSRLLEAEQKILGIDHLQAGVKLLEGWQLEQNSIDALRYQAMPLTAVLDATERVRICWLANQLATCKQQADLAPAAEALFQIPPPVLSELHNRVNTSFAAELDSRHAGVPLLLPLQDNAVLQFEQHCTEALQKLQLQILSETALGALEALDSSDNDSLKLLISRALQQFEVEPCFILLTSTKTNKQLVTLTSNRIADMPADLALQLIPGRSLLADMVLSGELATLSINMPGLSVIDRQLIDLLGGKNLLCESVQTDWGRAVMLLLGSATYPQRNMLRAFIKRKLSACLQQPSPRSEVKPQFDLMLYQQRVREAVHEANNPLAIIKNYLQILSIKQKEAEASKEIGLINTEIDRVAAILSGLRQTETALAPASELDINALLRSMHKLFTQAFSVVKPINIELDLTDDPALVWAKADGLKQILTNLVKNAAEAFTASGTIVLATRRNVFMQEKLYMQLSVTDNGPGIAAEKMQGLFVSGNSTKGGDHAGAGLAIVKKLVDAMNGQISCQSDSKGTVISILLPPVN